MNYDFGPGVNKAKNNIFTVSSLFYFPPKKLTIEGRENRKNTVIFWGADTKNLPPGISEKKFLEISNLCLDFVRKNCPGYELIYKLHPAETDEYTHLNLESFKIVGTETIGEFYLLKNLDNIKYTFSVCSGASNSAHKMGINSYVFVRLFEHLFRPETKKGYREYLSRLPKQSFITDLNRGFEEYEAANKKDEILNENYTKLLNNGAQKAWFIIEDPGDTATVISQANLIRDISPECKIGLLIIRHHRWDVMNLEDLKKYFDSINIFERTFYSLRPNKLFKSFKIARQIKKFFIDPKDILIGFTCTSFVENCFISYHKKGKRLAFLPKITFDASYGIKSEEMLAQIAYRPKLASRFYNLFFEPLLGLYRTIYMDDPGKVMNFRRYQKSVNEIYDQVYLI